MPPTTDDPATPQAGDQPVVDPMGGAASTDTPTTPADPMGGSTEPVTPSTGGETSTEETTTGTPDEANATPEATEDPNQAPTV